jgi:RNA polymerase sigma-70 factor (ECF subfamily)
MAHDSQEFHALIARVCAGAPDSARELVEKYGSYLLRVIRRRLHKKLRSKFDSQDFVQDVWASFFATVPEAEAFRTPEHLIAYLERLARNRLTDVIRQRMIKARYNVNREQQSLNDSRAGRLAPPAARVPTPSTIAMSREEWDRLLAAQPLVYRHILLLRRDGQTLAQIAKKLRISERTVRRVLAKLLPGLAS